MVGRLVLELVIAALAVIGFYTVLCAWGELFSVARPLSVAILVTSEGELDELDVWLSEARRRTVRGRGVSPVVLIAPSVVGRFLDEDGCPSFVFAELLEQYGATWYLLPADAQKRLIDNEKGDKSDV